MTCSSSTALTGYFRAAQRRCGQSRELAVEGVGDKEGACPGAQVPEARNTNVPLFLEPPRLQRAHVYTHSPGNDTA